MKKFKDMLRTPHDDIGRTYAWHRAAKIGTSTTSLPVPALVESWAHIQSSGIIMLDLYRPTNVRYRLTHCCNGTFTDVMLTILLAKNV